MTQHGTARVAKQLHTAEERITQNIYYDTCAAINKCNTYMYVTALLLITS